MAFYGPPPPLTFEQWCAAGERDPGFEAWKRDVQSQKVWMLVALVIGPPAVVALTLVAMWIAR